MQNTSKKVSLTLICEEREQAFSFKVPTSENQLKNEIALCFKKKPENFLSLLSPEGGVVLLGALTQSPEKFERKELTAIFSESQEGNPVPVLVWLLTFFKMSFHHNAKDKNWKRTLR